MATVPYTHLSQTISANSTVRTLGERFRVAKNTFVPAFRPMALVA